MSKIKQKNPKESQERRLENHNLSQINNHERFMNTMRYQEVDCRPLHLVEPWFDTIMRWHKEGLPEDVKDVHEYLGVKDKALKLIGVTGIAGIYPLFEQSILEDDGETVISIDGYGRKVKNFKNHTSFPEWLEFLVKTGDDLRRIMDEHFDVSNLDARYNDAWKANIAKAKNNPDAVIVLDGGCYYWTLRSLAGIENAAYLLYDAPELIDELFERYFTVVMEGFRRIEGLVKIDVVGFGEDIAYKNGPFVSPELFRQLILPRYRKTMELAHKQGIDFTWYDSDGDVRLYIPDYLSVGINGLAPCEVAAGMDPVVLRRQFGKELRMIGGFDKRIAACGKEAIDAEFARLRPVIEEGGYIPAIDHSVSADISWDNYRYYLDAVQKAVVL